ncbi:LytR/AlgR family response regulator transcription factor [Sediminicola luteus]|uniref:DNA-binding response regulator n=1 Tax=Sediminicola luteus TaxID=319238 RepID=A0A2A4G5B8_9FLAO|nr:response regulator transcription factor [Sediminicola luteus]PCE63621.1 DNA-binding response regulator [Sediminicola luteus]
MNRIKCVIVDDEPLAVNVLKNYSEQIEGLEVVETFNNALKALDYLRQNQPDLLFLDINMAVLDGLSLLRSLDNKPLVVITTAHEEFAVESYELEVLDYLVKPISLPRFIMATNRVFKLKNLQFQNTHEHNERAYIFVKVDKKKLKKVYLDEILVVESLKDYIKINTENDKHIIHQTLGSFTDSLPSDKFIRIHRSFTIAMDKVETVEGNSVEIGAIRYPIGRSYVADVKQAILRDNIGLY